jgi:aldehyde dehydrogenase (NAD+)
LRHSSIVWSLLAGVPIRFVAAVHDTSVPMIEKTYSYVLSQNVGHAKRVAERLQAGRVVVNGAPHEPLAPFGGFKQSGIGREFGTFGLDAFLEPRAILS